LQIVLRENGLVRSIIMGRFEVRPDERVLLVDGQPVPLGARAFDVLVALIERRDRVVSKNELLDLAWPGLQVEENNLSVQISTLRRVLGPQSIATVTGRGYRLVVAEPSGAALPSITVPPGTGERIVRRLAAIAMADVVDWQASLTRTPDTAIADWRMLRTCVVEPLAAAVSGRIVELTAQCCLLEFDSAVDGLRWALDLQDRMAEHRVGALPTTAHMRVGLCVEDAIVDDGKLIGAGRHLVEPLLKAAMPDDVVVDDTIRVLAQNKLPVRFRALDDGGHGPEGSRILYIADLAFDPSTERSSRMGPSWNGRPGVAVMPFDTGPDSGERYFGDGMTEEIVTSLSLNRGLLVIARNSTLRYRGSSAPPSEVAAELGVRYLLMGSVRRNQQQLRINAELVDAGANGVAWAEHYDGSVEDLFGFQTRIAHSIAAAIDPRVQETEMVRVLGRPTESLGAYDSMLRGMSVLNTFKDDDVQLAGRMFRRAIELDPNYARAHAHLGWWHNLQLGEGRSVEISEDAQLAETHSQRAIELDSRDAWALAVAAHIQSFVRKRFTTAMELFDQALELNPSCAIAWARSGTTLAYMGQGDEALRRVRQAMRLSPFDQHMFSFCTTNGTACIVAGRYAEAVSWLHKARRLNPGYKAALRMLTAALALSNEEVEARETAQELLRGEPGFRVSVFASWYPLSEPHLGRLLDGMRRAGLPD
jgi:adenylate cyclase